MRIRRKIEISRIKLSGCLGFQLTRLVLMLREERENLIHKIINTVLVILAVFSCFWSGKLNMCENAPRFLINGDARRNKLQYVLDQAIAGDQVMHILPIRNRVLVEWEKLKFPDCKKNYVELLNKFVGNG